MRLHSTPSLPLLDCDASRVTRDDADDVAQFEQFVLTDAASGPLPVVLRIQEISSDILVERSLARSMLDQGFEGLGFIEPETLAGKPLEADLGYD
jgi:hypothetical protein